MSTDPPALLTMIDALIRSPSVSSVSPEFDQGNRGVIELLADWLDNAGFRVEIMPLSSNPAKANLIATLGQGPGGLVLSGHTDTVPYDEGKWQYDPFTLTEADNRLYGLGTSDMKAFLALAIEALRNIRPQDLREPVIILATADEESSMAGAQALVDRDALHANHALIGEPTGLRPVRMHKGIMMEAIRLHGHSGHSSDPALGNSALEAMHTVLSALLAWRHDLQEKYRDPLFAVPVPTLNLGHIHGGDNPNRICPDCELQFDLRPLPGMSISELRHDIHRLVRDSLQGSGIRVEFEALFEGIPAMETDRDARIVQLAEQLTGHSAGAVAFGTEAPYLQQLGMQPVVLGPGDIEQAHQPDEFLATDRLQPTIRLLQQLVKSICT
ncbi:MAG: acetylornithine deacetylase [Pseudomonadota bacterium]